MHWQVVPVLVHHIRGAAARWNGNTSTTVAYRNVHAGAAIQRASLRWTVEIIGLVDHWQQVVACGPPDSRDTACCLMHHRGTLFLRVERVVRTVMLHLSVVAVRHRDTRDVNP